jgi:hypothetical protein
VEHVADSAYATRVTCTGRINEDIHEPWLLVRRYMEGLPKAVSHVTSLSERYRSSLEFRRFRQEVISGDLYFYYETADTVKCLRIVRSEPAARTDLIANCAIELRGKPAALLFDVVRNKDKRKWEIDGIKIQ